MISTESENNSSPLLRANGIMISLMTKIIWPRSKGILMAVKELWHQTTMNCKTSPMWTSNSSNAKTWNWPKEWTRANSCFKKLWAKSRLCRHRLWAPPLELPAENSPFLRMSYPPQKHQSSIMSMTWREDFPAPCCKLLTVSTMRS